MSDATVTPVGAPIIVDPSTSKPPVATNSAPAAVATDEQPSWLAPRLARERAQATAQALKDAGFDSPEDAKAAGEERKAEREAKKSVTQRNVELEATLKANNEAMSAYARGQLATLNDVQRAAVAAVAGDDPAKQLLTIEALKPSWAGAAVPAATAVKEAPKDTAPAHSAPKDTGHSASPPDLKAIHADLKAVNPVAAARFAIENRLFDNK